MPSFVYAETAAEEETTEAKTATVETTHTTQHERSQACAAEFKAKKLAKAEYKKFMHKCMGKTGHKGGKSLSKEK